MIIKEVAKQLSISKRRVQQLIHELGIEVEKVGPVTVLTEDQIQALAQRNTRPGPKPSRP